jgi:hypothetical protein
LELGKPFPMLLIRFIKGHPWAAHKGQTTHISLSLKR